MKQFILTLACPDKVGIVYQVSGFLADRGANILESAQFDDTMADYFFMRIHFEAADDAESIEKLNEDFQAVAQVFNMRWRFFNAHEKVRTMILVSRQGHCLNDLLYRAHTASLPIDIVAVVSNHADFKGLVEAYQLPFYHFPLLHATKEEKEAQEKCIMQLIDEYQVDLVVLARYMQILSSAFCQEISGKAINIHHSFLPSFKGARPYHQAFDKGVKLIGATAHFVTTDLDEGPIIEQDVVRVDHRADLAKLTQLGNDVERITLAHAIRYFAEHRIILNGHKTVVFN